METSYQLIPASLSAASAARYRSAATSSDGYGSSPRRIRAASRVPSSTIRAYALMWSAPVARAAASDPAKSASVSPGVP